MGTEERTDHIEILVRGVCVKDGRLLVCRTKGEANTYLPGGHVDFGERSRDALEREILEELNVGAEIGTFFGAVEHTFMQNGRTHCEINLVFSMEIGGMDTSKDPQSNEDYIEFLWLMIDNLCGSDLEPKPLRDLIPRWLTSSFGNDRWGSTI